MELKKGIEMSVVRAEVCKPFVYPTLYEFHFSIGHLDWYREDPEEYIRELKGTDVDLAAHFTILGKRGRCLYGPPIGEVFAEVPREDYWDSIWNDIGDAGSPSKPVGSCSAMPVTGSWATGCAEGCAASL